MRRRRRREYTPAQEAARKELERAELWVNIVACGIAEQLKRGHYCDDGLRGVVAVVNKELDAAATGLETAQKAHDEAFGRSRAVRSTVVLARRFRVPRATKGKKAANKKEKKEK